MFAQNHNTLTWLNASRKITLVGQDNGGCLVVVLDRHTGLFMTDSFNSMLHGFSVAEGYVRRIRGY